MRPAVGIAVPDGERWNHNIEYFPVVEAAVPAGSRRALDVGCGEGFFTRRLAALVPEVVGLDRDAAAVAQARQQGGGARYVRGDLLRAPFPPGSFDLVATVTTVHQVGTAPGLAAMADLVRPGGTVAAIGVARSRYPRDGARDLAAAVGTRLKPRRAHLWETPAPKVWPPDEDFRQVRRAVERALPGAAFRRHLLWRWSATWTKPRV